MFIKLSEVHILKRRLALILFVAVCLPGRVVVAQETGNSDRAAIEIISIEHRDPLYVKAQLELSLDPRGNIGLVDNKLIIASTAGNIRQLRTLLETTDVPARSLVVSVDFEYGGTRPENAGQQSTQALEGDAVIFADRLTENISEPASAENTSLQPRLVINSAVRGDSVDADVEIFNVPGFSGIHPITLSFGQWYVINPDSNTDVEQEPASAEIFEGVPIQQAESLPTADDESLPQVAPIAIRVDVLP